MKNSTLFNGSNHPALLKDTRRERERKGGLFSLVSSNKSFLMARCINEGTGFFHMDILHGHLYSFIVFPLMHGRSKCCISGLTLSKFTVW